MPFKLNPVTSELDLTDGAGGSGGGVDTITGDSGGAVSPDGSGNFNLIGDATQAYLTTEGTPASNQIEVKLLEPAADGELLIGHTANAEPSVATLTAGSGISIANGAGAITISSTATSSLDMPTDSGTASAAGGEIDIFGGSGITTSGSGNTVTITAAAIVPTSFVTDSGTAAPVGNTLNIVGGTGISTSGSGSTVTVTAANNGDVVGPGSSTDNAVARYDGTTGKLLQDSSVLIDDSDVMSGITQLNVDNLRLDGNTVSSTDVNGDVILGPNGTGGAVVTTDLTVGNASQDVSFTVNGASIAGTVSAEGLNASDLGGYISHRHSATAGFGGHFLGLRSRGSHASPSVVADNDVLYLTAAAGHDGTDYALAGQISIEVDGTPGANDMPGRIILSTSADGAQTPTEAFRIDSSQVITLANALPVASGGTGDTSYTNGQLLIGNTTGNTLGKATLTAGDGISITNGASSITVATSGGGLPWTVVTGATQALAVDNGYIGNRATAITYTLPDTAAVGSIIRITNIGAGLPVIAQNAGESINVVGSTTTVGVEGSLTATEQFDSIELVCVVADTTWNVLSMTGNWTVS